MERPPRRGDRHRGLVPGLRGNSGIKLTLGVDDHAAVVDSEERPVAVIETTEVRVIPIRDVDEDFARDEGEGTAPVQDWRAAHERFWSGDEWRRSMGGTSPW
ncbi:ASCH domain-containing protein [Planomonospora algeriensis]